MVLSILAFLLAVLLPGMAHARRQARSSVCQSNIRQIALANDLYSQDCGGVYCPGAVDIRRLNRHRWHGMRNSGRGPFDSTRGPLVPYLGPEEGVRACPSFEPGLIGFEAGCGGYGYNNAYIGVQTVEIASKPVPAGSEHDLKSLVLSVITSDRAGAYVARIKHPGETIMFTDAALLSGGLIEYSFAEPRFFPQFGTRADPSIHFRHDKTANVAWCDGHVTRERRTFTWSSGTYPGDPDRFDIGWFGHSDDNRLFDLR